MASAGGNGGPNAGVGNPINVITGNKYQREDDLPSLPGVLGLEIVRHHNSAFNKPNFPNGPMGREWRLSYETELFDRHGKIQVLQADGGRIIFNRDPKNPDLCTTTLPANGRITLARQANGTVEYDWVWTSGRRLHFNSRGKLERIAAPTGEAVDLLYDSDDLLVRVTDPQGRSMSLVYLDRAQARAGDRFRGVQHIDTPVGRFSYEYGSALPKGATPINPQQLLANLVRVRLPVSDGAAMPARPLTGTGGTKRTISRLYHHENAQFPWLMTGFSLETTGEDGKTSTVRIATFGYDGNGRANLSTHADDVGKVTLDSGAAGKTVLTNSLGQRTTYRHAIVGGEYRLLEVLGPGCALCGQSNVRYGYDKQGQLTETTRLGPHGQPEQTLRAELDHLGRPLRVSLVRYRQGRALPPEWLRRYEYGSGDTPQPTLVARPRAVAGREARLETEYNSRGQPLRITERGWSPALSAQDAPLPIERSTVYEYRQAGSRSLLTQVDGPLRNGRGGTPADSDITRYEYDAGGNLVRVVAPGGVTTEVTQRDDALRAVGLRTVDGARTIETRLAYGHDGRALGITRRASQSGDEGVLERVTGFRHDAALRLAAVVGPGNVTWRTEYDSAGRVQSYVDGKGNRIDRQLDSEGKLIARVERDAQGRTLGGLLNLWDEHNQLRARLHPGGVINAMGTTMRAGESIELDGNGDAAAATLRENGADLLAADDSARHLWLSPHAMLMQDGAHRLHAVIKDDFGRTVAERSPDEGLLVFSYPDNAVEKRHTGKGNVNIVTERLEFLADGRLHRRVRPDCVEAFRYEGRLLAGVDGCGNRHDYRRDAFGQITEHKQTVDGPGALPLVFRTSYAYDAATGQLTERILPDGQHLRYRYDPVDGSATSVARDRGWLAWVGRSLGESPARLLRRLLPQALASEPVIAQVEWRPFGGGMAAVTAANGLTSAGTFDASGRMAALQVSDGVGQPVESLTYQYDGAGNLVHRIRNGAPLHYRYDAMRRLLGESGESGLRQIALRHSLPGIRAAVGAPPRYDEFGRLEERNGQRFAYNSAHQLVSVTQGGKEIARYRYDALGNRVAKTVGGATTYFLYDVGHQLVAEADQSGKVVTQYLYVDGRPVAMMAADGAQTRRLYAVHADQRGLPLAVTDEMRRVVWRGDFDAHGNARQGTAGRAGQVALGTFTMPLRMAGQYEDRETGLYYNVHRYYDPKHGRYITPDPLGLAGGEESYAYVKGNPLAGTDPLGLFHIPKTFVAGASPLNSMYSLEPDQGHGDIVRIAFSQYLRTSGNEGRFSQQFVDWVIRNNYHTDVSGSINCVPAGYTNGGGQCNPKNHFDNPNNGPKYMDAAMTQLTKSYQDGQHDDWIGESLEELEVNRMFYNVPDFAPNNGVDISRVLSAFGQNTHALADFYAHSNWVDGVARGGCVNNIAWGGQVFERGYVPVGMAQTVVWNEKNSPLLYTGTVARQNKFCQKPVFGDVSCEDKTTHGYWNKDVAETDAGKETSASFAGMKGWRIEEFDPNAVRGDIGKPGGKYGLEWYSEGAISENELKKGDLIYVSYDIKNTHQMAFYLAVEHTKLEIARLFDRAQGTSLNGQNLRDIFKMDRQTMKKNHVVYDRDYTKL